MGTRCPVCKTSTCINDFCNECGSKTESNPLCNWCGEEIWDYMNHCSGCGRTKHNAINTSPPPGKIKKFFSGLFGKKVAE